MAGGRPPSLDSFTCPNCNALYEVVKAEPGPETVDRAVACRSCGGPLAGRDGNLVLKYFLLRKRPEPAAGLKPPPKNLGVSI